MPDDLPERVLCDFESRMDRNTLLVVPEIGKLARKFHVSRSSIKRIVVGLRNNGYLELCHIKANPAAKLLSVRYKMARVPAR